MDTITAAQAAYDAAYAEYRQLFAAELRAQDEHEHACLCGALIRRDAFRRFNLAAACTDAAAARMRAARASLQEAIPQ